MTDPDDGLDETMQALGWYLAEVIMGTDKPIDPELNLLLDGGVDSLGMLKLVAFIELHFGVKVPPEQFTIENFRNLRVISRYVRTLAA